MRITIKFLIGFLGLSLFAFWNGSPSCRAAGVTVITHGLDGDVDGWIIPMAQRILGADAVCYQITVTQDSQGFYVSQTRLGGVNLTNSISGEIIIKLDWSQPANSFFGPTTTPIANADVYALLKTNFIPGLGGKSLAEFPVHLVRHSRGGSVISEMTRMLGAQGVWVDHMTTLDPHPIIGDADVHTYSNTLFADSYRVVYFFNGSSRKAYDASAGSRGAGETTFQPSAFNFSVPSRIC